MGRRSEGGRGLELIDIIRKWILMDGIEARETETRGRRVRRKRRLCFTRICPILDIEAAEAANWKKGGF